MPLNKKHMTPRPCKYCGQWMNEELLNQRQAQASLAVSKSLRERKEKGLAIGAPKKSRFEKTKILNLRYEGKSIRKIAEIVGCSPSTVMSVLKEASK